MRAELPSERAPSSTTANEPSTEDGMLHDACSISCCIIVLYCFFILHISQDGVNREIAEEQIAVEPTEAATVEPRVLE